MIQKPTDQITKSDIDSLISAKVSERRTLDYKVQLPGGRDDDKREFLYDVSSFANAAGGDMVFGVGDGRDENGKSTGLPESAEGLALSNVTDTITRLENLVRDGVEPRIQGIQWQPVQGFVTGPVIVMRIPRSLIAPHMVVFGGMARFYSRNSTGKYPLDIGEIRLAFIESTDIGERLKKLRTQRIENVMEKESLLVPGKVPMTIVHLIPFSSMAPNSSRDVTKAASGLQGLLGPIVGGGRSGRYNFDGYLVSNSTSTSKSYVQIFRSGFIEAVDTAYFDVLEEHKNVIASIDFEATIIESVRRYLEAQNRLSIPLPVFIAITLLGVRDFRMSPNPDRPFAPNHQIDRDILPLPEIAVEDYALSPGKLLRPAFDALWQACGFEKSMNYDDQGNWHPHRR